MGELGQEEEGDEKSLEDTEDDGNVGQLPTPIDREVCRCV